MLGIGFFFTILMKHFFLLAFFGLTAFASQAQWTLIWADEFGGSVLDSTKWVTETGGWGWGNNELQYYTDGDNLSVSNGALVIEAREEQFGSNSHTSGKIITKNLFEIKHGKIEARLKVPLGQGLWPAFWMLGENIDVVSWPQCGEIDVMEHINAEMSIHGTAHWNNSGHVYDGSSAVVNPSNYQTYTVEWNSDQIRWYLNGVQYHSLSIQNNTQSTEEFQLPFYLILNLAVGGDWPGYPDATTPFPSQVEVDYVRAYKLDAEASTDEIELVEFNVYPNPAVDQLTIESSMEGIARITDLNGALISEEEIAIGSTALSVEDLDNGMYMVSVQHTNGSTSSQKFIKE
jgi:beta-glucanase (GH16 family)